MDEWISIEEAEERGVDITTFADSIGPRRKGAVYFCRYWQTVNTVTSVLLRIRDGKATDWRCTEYAPDDVRDRTHMTPWDGDVLLSGPADTRPHQRRR